MAETRLVMHCRERQPSRLPFQLTRLGGRCRCVVSPQNMKLPRTKAVIWPLLVDSDFHRGPVLLHYWSERLPDSPASISFRLSACSRRVGVCDCRSLYQDVYGSFATDRPRAQFMGARGNSGRSA